MVCVAMLCAVLRLRHVRCVREVEQAADQTVVSPEQPVANCEGACCIRWSGVWLVRVPLPRREVAVVCSCSWCMVESHGEWLEVQTVSSPSRKCAHHGLHCELGSVHACVGVSAAVAVLSPAVRGVRVHSLAIVHGCSPFSEVVVMPVSILLSRKSGPTIVVRFRMNTAPTWESITLDFLRASCMFLSDASHDAFLDRQRYGCHLATM